MIVQFFINDDDMRGFFEGCGYACKMIDVPFTRRAYHNRCEVDMRPTLHVMVDKDNAVTAEKLFEQHIKERFLSPDLGAKLAIRKAIITLKQKR